MWTISDAALWVAAIAAGLTGAGLIAKWARNAYRRARGVVEAIVAIRHVVERELEHNHGSSIKDDVHGMAVAIGQLQRDRDIDRRRIAGVLHIVLKNHPNDAWLYLDPDLTNERTDA